MPHWPFAARQGLVGTADCGGEADGPPGSRPASVGDAHPSADSPGAVEDPVSLALELWVGLAAIIFSAVYFVSDLIEVAQGGFSTFRLSLTYAAEVAVPLFVLGLYALQRPRIGRLGLAGAVAYAYSYVFFTATVVYALVAGTPNWEALTKVFGVWMTVHGAILVFGGLAFGLAVIRARVLPRWTGVAVMVGVVLVAAASGSSNAVRTIAAAFPDAAFIGMGTAILQQWRPGRAASPTPLFPANDARRRSGTSRSDGPLDRGADLTTRAERR